MFLPVFWIPEVTDNEGNTKELIVSCLFVDIGRVPENQNFSKVVEISEDGYIIADENCHTSCPGIFAAGDTRVKTLRQVVTATSDGAISAMEAIKFINQQKRAK